MAFAPYVESLVKTIGVLNALGIEYTYWCCRSDFHIETNANHALTQAMDNAEITDIVLIDSDQSWIPEDFVRILLCPGSVVGASYRMKNRWDQYTGEIVFKDGVPVGKIMPDGKPLLEARKIAGGFLKIKTDVLRKFHEAYPDNRIDVKDGEVTTFFERVKKDKTVSDQDIVFCNRLIDIGVDLWIDPTLKVGHWGLTEFEGDFDAYLKYGAVPEDEEGSLKKLEATLIAANKAIADGFVPPKIKRV